MLTHHPSPALLPWLTPGGTTQENDRNVCFDARLKQGETRGAPTPHIPSWQPRPCTQHKVTWGINRLAEPKAIFLKGSILLVLSPQEISKITSESTFSTLLSSGRRENFFIIHVVFLGPGVSQHAVFNIYPSRVVGRQMAIKILQRQRTHAKPLITYCKI